MLISDTFFNYYLTFIGLSGFFTLLCNYFIFQKIGYSGISGVIPIYNTILLYRRYYGSGWYVLTLFIPFVNIWFAFGVYNRLRKDFNKSLEWFVLFLCVCFLLLGMESWLLVILYQEIEITISMKIKNLLYKRFLFFLIF